MFRNLFLLAAVLMASLAGSLAIASELEAAWNDAAEIRHDDRLGDRRPGHPGYPGRPGYPDRPGPGYPPPPPPPGPGPGYPPPPPPPGPGYGSDYVYQPMNQYLVGANSLRLRQILNLGPQMEGREVEYVVLRARTDAGQGEAQLEINGMRVGYSQRVDTWSRDYFFQVDAFRNRLGYDIQTLQLELQGRFTVEGVGVKLGRGHGGGGGGYVGSETRVLQQRFTGGSRVDLGYLFRGYENYRVRAVTIRASTAAGYGQARVCGSYSGCSVGQTVGTYLGTYTYSLFTGDTVSNLYLDLQGNFWIDSITVEFERRY